MSQPQQNIPLDDLKQKPQLALNDKPITSEPKTTDEMRQEQQKPSLSRSNSSSSSSSSSSSQSDDDINSNFTAQSGYHREHNECTEFCVECCTCFGVVDCCPRSGEGCVTNMATFIGNMLFACCKC
ncbi:hypothetical protein Cantr_07050 [Candida viswanathii]|uniref:Uncharacterized protein n=1 Tax=Candida viswanathii TaxID=5486 RepID=A0A367Y2W0_9ASCO|nr:hypothetical protein Cantr_07050 [Candida viswanathii]